jgi:hypothetical protein
MKKNNALMRELRLYSTIISDFTIKIFSVRKHFNQKKSEFYAGMEREQKPWFVFCNFFLSAYITFVFYIADFTCLLPERNKVITISFGSILVFLFVYNLITFICIKYNAKVISLLISDEKMAIKKETVVLYSSLCLIILLTALAASFPGGISSDTEYQWAQVRHFDFHDHHPVIHTLLIWLVTRIIHHYAFVVFVQIFLFSIGVGYLIATMESWVVYYCWVLGGKVEMD